MFLKQVFALFFVVFFFVNFVLAQNSHASPGRLRSCNPTTGTIEGLEFDPTNGGEDVHFVLSNPICATIAATSYLAVKTSVAAMNRICQSGSAWPRVLPSPFLDAIDIGKGGIKAATVKNPLCIQAVSRAVTSFSTVLTELGITYGVAKGVFDNSSVCGSNWLTVNPSKFDRNTANYKATVQNEIDKRIRENNSALLSLETGDKIYREWYYGGVEVEDNPNSGEICYDVTQAPNSKGEYPRQKYYLKGTEAGNFNCKKYLITEGSGSTRTAEEAAKMSKAYECCKKRSAEFICISYDPIGSYSEEKVFCKAGDNCVIKDITFSAKSLDDGRFVCAETYSLCPYNFSLSGGSEECDYYRDGKWDGNRWVMISNEDVNPPAGQAPNCSAKSEIRNPDCTYNSKAGRCRNYCQYMTHCTRTIGSEFRYRSSLTSPYFSNACLNFEGDSQNKTAYGGGFILGSQKHFSAPIAQCVKETLENVFYNRAGHSKCLNYDELSSADGTCASGQYAGMGAFQQKKGNLVKEQSFFTLLQDRMQDAVKLALTMSIMFYGMNLLLWKNDIREKKDILVYLLKIGLVLYFATGDAWQSKFFDGVYGVSTEFSRMVFKIETNQSELKRDGCQFGEITLPGGATVSSGRTYPPGKEYLAIWDTLDCKIMRYLGFGPEASVANIASLILAGFVTPFAALGVYFAVSVMFFGFFFISATIRALHIFLCSCLSIIMMVFISPLIFPMALFARTKSIFDKWVSNLISFCLQPMILFAYIAIFIIALDRTVIGSATFVGQGPFKAVSCKKICVNANGSVAPYVGNNLPACDENGQSIINPLDDSLACLINVQDFGKFPGLELVGLSIPMLINLFDENPKERILTTMKAALVMYLLCAFMDEISGITTNLIGGSSLSGAKNNPMGNLKKAIEFLQKSQKRGKGATKKVGGKAMRGAADMAKGAGGLGSKGKSVEQKLPKGPSMAGGSEGGSKDMGGKGDGGDDLGESGNPTKEGAGSGGAAGDSGGEEKSKDSADK